MDDKSQWGETLKLLEQKQSEIDMVKTENTKLKAELEVTQAVVDELLFGGAM